MTSEAPPHSRWLLRDSIDRLAASHDAVTVAVDALTRSAVRRSSAGDEPTIRQRITGGRGWSRTVWFGVATLLTGLFMAWISVRLLRHLSGAPDVVAVLPGLLLTLGLAVTAPQAAKSLERPSQPGTSTAVVPWTLLAAVTVGSVAWITLSLVITTSTAAWAAVIGGVALVAAATAGMLATARPAGTQPAAVAPRVRPLPRRLRAQRRRAQQRLRDHTREWNLAAHQYGAAIDGSDEVANALARLLADEADLLLEGIDPYDILVLTALRKYRPAPLTASFDAAVRYLHVDPAGPVPQYRGGPSRTGIRGDELRAAVSRWSKCRLIARCARVRAGTGAGRCVRRRTSCICKPSLARRSSSSATARSARCWRRRNPRSFPRRRRRCRPARRS